MNTFLLWVNKGSRKPKVQGKATAAAAALTIFDFSRMARKGAGRFYVVDAATADAARAAIDAFEKQSGQGLDVPVSETKFEGGGKITAIGARANQALEGAGVSISKWDERLARQGRVTDAQARALPNPFVSRAQQRWAFATKQPFARRWARKTRFAGLPERAAAMRKKRKRNSKRRSNTGARKRASRRLKSHRKATRKWSRWFQSQTDRGLTGPIPTVYGKTRRALYRGIPRTRRDFAPMTRNPRRFGSTAYTAANVARQELHWIESHAEVMARGGLAKDEMIGMATRIHTLANAAIKWLEGKECK